MAITPKIQALINYANETTGAGDTRLGDAVKTLCDGYGQGDTEQAMIATHYLAEAGDLWLLSSNNVTKKIVDGIEVAADTVVVNVSAGTHVVKYFFDDIEDCTVPNGYKQNTSLTELVIPEGCKIIRERFLLASGVKKLTIPKSVEVIEGDALNQLNLESVNDGVLDLPNLKTVSGAAISIGLPFELVKLTGMETVGRSAEYTGAVISNMRIGVLVFGENLTSMRDNCIDRCRIRSIVMRASVPPSLPDSAKNPFFQSNISSVTNIYVPSNAVDAYKNAAGWNYYASNIKSIIDL